MQPDRWMHRDDLDVHLVVMFSSLLFLKCFHWISTDRVDYVSRDFVLPGSGLILRPDGSIPAAGSSDPLSPASPFCNLVACDPGRLCGDILLQARDSR